MIQLVNQYPTYEILLQPAILLFLFWIIYLDIESRLTIFNA